MAMADISNPRIELLPCDPSQPPCFTTQQLEDFMPIYEIVSEHFLIAFMELFPGIQSKFIKSKQKIRPCTKDFLFCSINLQKLTTYFQKVKDNLMTFECKKNMNKTTQRFHCDQCSNSFGIQITDPYDLIRMCTSRGQLKACQALFTCGKQLQTLMQCIGQNQRVLNKVVAYLKMGMFPCMGCDILPKRDMIQVTCFICNSKLNVQLDGPESRFETCIRQMKLKPQLFDITSRTRRFKGENGYCNLRTWCCPYLQPALEFHQSQCPCITKVTEEWRAKSIRGLLSALDTANTSAKVQKNPQTQEAEIHGTCDLCQSKVTFLLEDTCPRRKKVCRQGENSESCLIMESIRETWALIKDIKQDWKVLKKKFLHHMFNGNPLKTLIEGKKLNVSVDEELDIAVFFCNCFEELVIGFNPHSKFQFGFTCDKPKA